MRYMQYDIYHEYSLIVVNIKILALIKYIFDQ